MTFLSPDIIIISKGCAVMKEYKVIELGAGKKYLAERKMNDMARQGWRVVSITCRPGRGISLIKTFERDV